MMILVTVNTMVKQVMKIMLQKMTALMMVGSIDKVRIGIENIKVVYQVLRYNQASIDGNRK